GILASMIVSWLNKRK
ncbi:TPA: type I toxin-antitoxin system toxin Ldr family protein, partial [Escherichia coli]|nr:type I toxin-antitoxin system toxin Ldr family protein [Escherichia coli]HDD8271790.1 type I toxin-antitoxin system toxin Ldr family protein [Escherichia coli]